jgi:hypothetical protein
MTTRRKEHLCGDTINSFGREDHRFQWSRSYWYYSSLPPPERNVNQIWTSGISQAGCVLEVFDFKELISWCIDKFDKNQRIIQLQGESPISLAPSVFKRMLRLPEPTMNFKGDEAKYF